MELLRRIGAGDSQALAEFYDLHAGLVNGLALRIVRERGDAEDVVQEVFVQAWRQAARFDAARGTPEAWLCTIARSRALDKLRRRAARREDARDEAPEAPSRETARTATPQTELSLAVRQALRGLSDDQRAALELAYYEGLSQSEIALRLGEPLGTVKTRIRTAMLRLRTRCSHDPGRAARVLRARARRSLRGPGAAGGPGRARRPRGAPLRSPRPRLSAVPRRAPRLRACRRLAAPVAAARAPAGRPA